MQLSDTSQASRWSVALAKTSTTGAAAKTVGRDQRSARITASHQMAKTDLPHVLKIIDHLRQVSIKFDIPVAIIAALASRESRCGDVLDARGFGDSGNAFGILQVDRRFHNLAGVSDPSSLAHIEQAVSIFVSLLQQVQTRHRDWEDEFILKGAIAVYGSGVGNIATKGGMDLGTTGDDYSSDVIARAQFYVSHL